MLGITLSCNQHRISLRNKMLVIAISCPRLYKLWNLHGCFWRCSSARHWVEFLRKNVNLRQTLHEKHTSTCNLKRRDKEFSAALRKCFLFAEVQTLIIMDLILTMLIFRVFIESQGNSHEKAAFHWMSYFILLFCGVADDRSTSHQSSWEVSS